MTFLLEEDAALKARLVGLMVQDDQRQSRPVEVWYGQPDLELRNRTYPYISIELIDINEARERVVNGTPNLTYLPSGWTAPAGTSTLVAHNFPTPYDLDYQVTAWSRHPRHDRHILQQLLQGPLPIRFGQLHLLDTGRYVRLDMLGGPRVADTTDENGKRLFRKVFTVRVATELFLNTALEVAGLIQSVHVNAPSKSDPRFTPITTVIGALPPAAYDTSSYNEAAYQ